MGKVTGIGGVFFKTADPEATRSWYRDHLGVDAGPWGKTFHWRDVNSPDKVGSTVWSPFAADTDYFGAGPQPFMVNYRVEDLDGLLDTLRAAGVTVDERIEEQPYGRFAWVVDPDGRRVELWEPPAGDERTGLEEG